MPEQVRERVAQPLGRIEEDDGELDADAWFPPTRPVFKGAQSARGPATPDPAPAQTPAPRRRRSEPLRGR